MRNPPSADGVLDESFEAIIFDWEGTAVPDRQADATRMRRRIEALCRLPLCCNRGSEIFEVTGAGPALVLRRTASADDETALDRAAARTVELLGDRGVDTGVLRWSMA
jgi:hypothetical protein